MKTRPPIGARTTLTMRVTAMAIAVFGVGVLLAVTAVARNPHLPFHLPLWAPFVGLLMSGLAPLMLEVESNTFSLSLTEIPIVLCLLGLPRTPMFALGTAGWLVALLLGRKRQFVKLLFNVPLIFFEMVVTAAVFDTIVPNPRIEHWTTWLGLSAGLVAAIAFSTTAVNVVILLAGDSISWRQATRHSALGMVNAVMACALTVTTLLALRGTPFAIIPLLLLAPIVVVPIRRQALLQRRFDSLLLLHEFTGGLTSSTDLATTLHSVVSETAKVLRANHSSIILKRDCDGSRVALRADESPVPMVGDAVWNAVLLQGRSIHLAASSDGLDGYLAASGTKDLMAVPLVHGSEVIGALVVCDRLGDISTFDHDDLSIFATMANQTTVTLENLRLIDELREESAEREHQSLHDELTGLPNRAHLYLRLDQALADGEPPIAVAMLDLNRFKDVNDTLGHHAGDRVLVQTAQRLRDALPNSAFVARLGGDEFAVLLFGITGRADAVEKLIALEMVFLEPIGLDAMSLRIDASIGVAVSPADGADRVVLLKRADVAMYAAKQTRGTSVRAYTPTQERSSTRSLQLVGHLRAAIDDNTIDVAFQPKAHLVTGAIVGAEALARWHHPQYGPVAPDEFIPLAERAGLIGSLTTLVLRRSLEALGHWQRYCPAAGVAVNINAQTLLTPGFVGCVAQDLHKWNIEPRFLTLEITEREFVRELDASATAIESLRSLGVAFSIDDFGTGYSSLSYLTRLPVDEIKIDRSFVAEVTASRKHAAIVRAVADIARDLGLATVVEGIEDERTWETVARLGCTFGQGYHLARPMASDALTEWLAERERTARS